MNIFYLHPNPRTCAEYHVDKHVVKMIVETAQLLSTAHRFLDGTQTIGLSVNGRKMTRYVLDDDREQILYKASHINHPSAKWCRHTNSNYLWLHSLLVALCNEYTYRYGKIHKVETDGLMLKLSATPKNISIGDFSPPWRAMPENAKVGNDTLASYHKYYIEYKNRFAKWTKREVPEWYKNGVTVANV